jgi:dTDP-4-dehydrorhamnose 3,5-epimerase
MIFTESNIKGLFIIEPKVFEDERGYFFESYNQKEFAQKVGETVHFVQDNESMSMKGVVRGLHFQAPPFDQGKLVRVSCGSVLDVAVDIRKNSPSYGEYFALVLSGKNRKQLWIPPGFLHGFATLENETVFNYKCTNYYSPQNEGTVSWEDKALNIDWQTIDPTISVKDQTGQAFDVFESPFE